MDGPNVNFGEHASVHIVLKISMIWDFNHCSVLTVTHHTKGIPEMLKLKELMSSICADLYNSYKKQFQYRNIFCSPLEDIIEFESCSAMHCTYVRKT